MDSYLISTEKWFRYYKKLGEQAIEQLEDEALFFQYNEESNSIATIMKHLSGNMLSRWTDCMNSDGEKPWRDRDSEFETDITNRAELLNIWNEGWNCLFSALDSITETDLQRAVYIRNEKHSLTDAINRQLAHYPYHIGQMVFIAKMIAGPKWRSLSIPKAGNKQ